MNEIFARPGFVYLGIAVVTGLGLLWPWAEARRRRALSEFAELDLVEPLLPPDASHWRWIRNALRFNVVFFLFLAAAGPRWGVESVESNEFGVHVVLAVDVSTSMQSQDVKPNRLEKAKRALANLIDSLQGSRVGIVAFSGMAAIQCPLTTDINAARLFLGAMRVDMLPIKGTAVGDAVRLATKMLAPYPGVKGVVLFTDGEDHKSDPLGAAQEAAAKGVRVFSLGIGKPEGEPIPILDGDKTTGYKRDEKGQIVLSKLDERTLSEMARLTGGAYFRATASESEISDIVEHLNNLDRSRLSSGVKERLADRTYVPLSIALFLLGLELLVPIRKLVPSFAVLLLLLSASNSQAGVESEVRKGNSALDAHSYEEALDRYAAAGAAAPEDVRPTYNEGIALYRLGKFQEAADKFHKAAESTTDPLFQRAAQYNEGNAKFRAEKPDEAAKDYRGLIIEDPTDPIVRHNLQVALKRQQDQKQKEKQDPKKDKKDDKNKGGQTPPPQGGMNKEDAERVMQAQKEKEKSNADPNQYNRAGKQQKPTRGGAPEDW